MTNGQVLEIVCDDGEADAVVDHLWQLGATGTAEEARGDGRVRILAGFGDADPTAVQAAIEREHPDVVVTLGAPAPSTWREHVQPRRIGPFGLRFPEHPPVPSAIDLCIEPGEAFGAGTHESTRLALAAIVSLPPRDLRVADVGTGTGILAIAAALLEATIVEAVDTDPSAARLTERNARLNGVAVSAHVGSVADLEEAPFDLIAANLTAATHRQLAPGIARCLRPDGTIVVSGLLHHQVADVAAAYQPALVIDHTREGQWSCVTLVNR